MASSGTIKSAILSAHPAGKKQGFRGIITVCVSNLKEVILPRKLPMPLLERRVGRLGTFSSHALFLGTVVQRTRGLLFSFVGACLLAGSADYLTYIRVVLGEHVTKLTF